MKANGDNQMKTCNNCESEFEMQPVRDSIIIEDKFLGKFTTKETEVLMCRNCNEFVITKEISHLIENKTDEKRNKLIKALPFSKFISTKKASEILSISRQAIHKNNYFKRIVYNAKIDNQLFFVKKSVEKYKDTGDGRFNLSQGTKYSDFKIYLHGQSSSDLTIMKQEFYSDFNKLSDDSLQFYKTFLHTYKELSSTKKSMMPLGDPGWPPIRAFTPKQQKVYSLKKTGTFNAS